MLHFEPCTPENLIRIAPLVARASFLCNDWSLGTVMMWRGEIRPRFCLQNGTLLFREEINGQAAFSWPIGPDERGMLDALSKYVEEENLPLRFFALDEETLEKARRTPGLTGILAARDDRWSDYLYDFSEMASFAGRKFSGQRNHINKYRKLYGEPEIRFLTPEDGPAVREMLEQYEQEHPCRNTLEEAELRHTYTLLRHCAAFGMPAAGLILQGRIAAFTIGEIVGDMLIIHVEKALRSAEGAYPTLFHGFVNRVQHGRARPLRFVNREDDAGDPGLRTSKQQYHPVARMPKYLAHVDAPGAQRKEWPVLPAGPVVLTPLRETDREAYLRLNTDVENNRWWGYDYRRDENITGPVDENTFYDSVRFDMAVGDSVNFAVRETPGGPMIGEALLWNFTSRRRGEVGIRLFPAFHGKGYGGAAVRALVRFGRDALGLSLGAHCCLENLPSYRMLTRCGFRECGRDGTYFYFDRADE